MPPLDPTTSPSASRIPVRVSHVDQRQVRAIAKPILASECLKDDIAPLEPFPRLLRVVLAVSGVVAIAGAAILLKAALGTLALAAFFGGATLTTAAAVPSYRVRAALGVLGAAATLIAVLSGQPSFAARALASIVLASALFTRAGYRAHRGVRVALAVGVILFGAAAATSVGAQLSTRVAAGAMVVATLTSLLGFMGEQTTGGAAWWGALALLTAGASIAAPVSIALFPLGVVVTLVCACVAAAVSLFALAASVIAPGERARTHHAPISVPPSNDSD